ncbi:uncharacterized protein LOC124716808 [Schistocerca piceifrons]|uniref:uncharacterized protein LOC124716808 n=1 Tax=Schistocerca piceifrons TaxID=274613 RepID=UPI001F5FAC11|nr:uncharacterized protein LOC124716808 [Schistocerca piceifrons]
MSFVSERIIRARVNLGKNSFTILKVYAPQQGSSEEEKTKFLEELEGQVREIVITGDLNAQIGTDRNGYEEVMVPFGYGRRNVEGEEILKLCIRNHLLVKNTFFKKQDSHKITRYGWDGESKTVIDYILTEKLIGGKVRDTKVIPSEHLDSDYRLLIADLNDKVKSLNAVQRMPKIKE